MTGEIGHLPVEPMKPEESDVVQLLRLCHDMAFPPAREEPSSWTTKASRKDLPAAYQVKFSDVDGVTQALVTVLEDDVEVVWRASPSH